MSAGSASITVGDVERFHRLLGGSSASADSLCEGSRVSLAAASELACILLQSNSKDLTKTIDSRLTDCPMWGMFKRMRVATGPRRTNHGSIVLSKIPSPYNETWYVSEARRFEANLLSGRFPQGLAKSLTGAVFEMVDNVWKHSGVSKDALLGYQIHNRTFSFIVTDMGDGVLKTLTKNRRFAYLKTSIEALEEAVKPNVSGDLNGSGLGLDNLTRAFANLWGRTRLRSGQGALTFNREGAIPKRTHQFLPDLNGFQISAVCRLSPPDQHS